MLKYTLKIDGMMCAHCEAHMTEAIKSNFDVKSADSSHEKKECVIVANELDEDKLAAVVGEAGYTLVSIDKAPYEKKGIFAKFKK